MSVFLFINEQAKPSAAKWRVNPIRHLQVGEQHCSHLVELNLVILM